MYSSYKSICKGLSTAVLIFGVIGSIIFAVISERSVPITLAVLVTGLFNTGVLYTILAGLGEVLEYLEFICEKEYKSDDDTFEHSK